MQSFCRRLIRCVGICGGVALLVFDTPLGAASNSRPYDDSRSHSSDLLALYETLHQRPELAFHEEATAARMAAAVGKLGFEVATGVGGTGVVAVMRNGPGHTLLIRTEMDALPVTEETGLPYASKMTAAVDGATTGTMHACGHDIHMAVWVGTAQRLVATKQRWTGTVIMVAQPAEEMGMGAKRMLEDGLYERFARPSHVLALHSSATLPAGVIGYSPGYAFASDVAVDVTVRGVGGHGAYPQSTKDPVVVAARIVAPLQTLVAREIDPQSPGVVTVGSIHGGTSYNIIPDEVRLQLTVRSYDDETREILLGGIRRISASEAAAAGIGADRSPVVRIPDVFTPATFNTDLLTRKAVQAFEARFGKDNVVRVPASMAGEDFSRYRLADTSIESLIFWLGTVEREAFEASKKAGTQLPSLHSSKFAPDPVPTLATGVDAMYAAAMAVLSRR